MTLTPWGAVSTRALHYIVALHAVPQLPDGLPSTPGQRATAGDSGLLAELYSALNNGNFKAPMADQMLVLYGSYRSDRLGIRLADFLVGGFSARGEPAELIDAKAVGLPMLDRMYKEYPAGTAPPAMETLAAKIRSAHAFVFVVGEYNWGMQPGLKNLTDHFLEEWFWRPAAIVSYSAGRLAGARSNSLWHATLSEMGMVVVSSTLTVGSIAHALGPTGQPVGETGQVLEKAFPRFADDLAWWTQAAKNQHALKLPPY